MARFDCDTGALDELISGLAELAEGSDEIAKDCIDAATPILVDAWKADVKAAASKGYATGGLANSIEATEAKTNAYGNFAAVRPVGTDGNGERYGARMAYHEYGRAGGKSKSGRNVPPQAPRPTLARSIARTEGKVTETMQKKFEEHVDRRIKS